MWGSFPCEKSLSYWEPVKESLCNTRACLLGGNIPAFFFDLGNDFWDGVRGAGDIVAEFTLEHGKVV